MPEAQQYTEEAIQTNTRVIFDHGALRTVACPVARFPPVKRRSLEFKPWAMCWLESILDPSENDRSRLEHHDFPETIAQFFVSELHPEQFSPVFQTAVTRVLSESVDPLGPHDLSRLQNLSETAVCPGTTH